MKVFKYEDGTYGETQIEIPYKRCPSNYFKKFPVGTYPPGLAETGICPDLSKIELNGFDYASDHFQRLGIILTKCVNNTNRPDIICKSSEEIEDFLKNPVIPIVATLFYTNTIISPTNYSTPSIYYLEYEEYYLPPTGFTMLVDVPINQQDLITDDNLLMEDWNTKSYTTYQIDPTEIKVRLSNQITDAGEEVMFTLWLRRSSKMYTTKRLYPKLQEGLASVGSVFTLCVAVFGIITAFYRNRAYAVNIANQLFEYDFYDPEKEKKKAENKEKTKSSSNKKEENLTASINSKLELQENPKQPDIEEELPKLLLGKKEKLRYHFGDFLLSLFPCFNRNKNKLIRKAIVAAEREIDLIEILKKLQQFDKLQQILLDEDELMMISYYQPPVISLGSSPFKGRNLQKKSTLTSKFQERIGRKRRRKPSTKLMQADQQSPKISKDRADCSNDANNANQTDDETALAITTVQSFNRLLQKRNASPISQKILKIMNPKVSDALFDFGREAKSFPTSSKMSLNKIKDNEKSVQQKSNGTRKMSKLEAAFVISNRLENYFLRRREKMKKKLEKPTDDNMNSHKEDQSNRDDLGDYSILSEKRPLEIVSPKYFEITSGLDQECRSPNITIQINEKSSPKIITSPNARTIQYQNSQRNHKVSYAAPSKQDKYRSRSRMISFPMTSFGDEGFDIYENSSRSEFSNLEKE